MECMGSIATRKRKTSSDLGFHVRQKLTGIVHARRDTIYGYETCCGQRFGQMMGFDGPVLAKVDCLECLISDEPVMPLPKDFVWLEPKS